MISTTLSVGRAGAPPLPDDMADSAAHLFGVRVSDLPLERIQQAEAFFVRNPGYMTPTRTREVMRDMAARIPGIRTAAQAFAPTAAGYGQPIVDQMQWQIDTGRMPGSAWWMRVNKRLVTDPLVAERAVREGRTSELVAPTERAWMAYIQASDAVKAALGLDPAATEYQGRPLATSDAYRGVDVLQRSRAVRLINAARSAYWKAHTASIDWGREHAMDALRAELGRNPSEAEFSHGWANVVDIYARINPPALGHYARNVQRTLLPGSYAQPEAVPSRARRDFARLLDHLDPAFEKLTQSAE